MSAPAPDIAAETSESVSPESEPLAGVIKRQARAAEYRGRALEAFAQAEASVLDRVRERHVAAGDRWRELAELSERVTVAPVVR